MAKAEHTSDEAERGRRKKKSLALDKHSRVLLSRFINDWLRPRWRPLLVALALTGGLALATGAYPMVIKFSFDNLLAGDVGWLPWVLVTIITITLARSVLLYFQTVETQRIGLRLAADMQSATFNHLMHADYARLTRDTPGRLMSKITNDIQFIQQATLASLNSLMRDSLSVVALVGSMFFLDWMISLIVLGVYPIAVVPIANIARRVRRNSTRTQAELGGMTSLLAE